MLNKKLLLVSVLILTSCIPRYEKFIRDEDRDFLPDSVNSWIKINSKDKNELQALTQLAFAYSMMLSHAADEKKFKKWLAEMDLASLCVEFVFSKYGNSKGLELQLQLSEEFKKNFLARYYFWRGYRNMQTGTYSVPNNDLIERGLACNFQIDGPLNIYEQYKFKMYEVVSEEEKLRVKVLYDKNSNPVDIYKFFGIGYR